MCIFGYFQPLWFTCRWQNSWRSHGRSHTSLQISQLMLRMWREYGNIQRQTIPLNTQTSSSYSKIWMQDVQMYLFGGFFMKSFQSSTGWYWSDQCVTFGGWILEVILDFGRRWKHSHQSIQQGRISSASFYNTVFENVTKIVENTKFRGMAFRSKVSGIWAKTR